MTQSSSVGWKESPSFEVIELVRTAQNPEVLSRRSTPEPHRATVLPADYTTVSPPPELLSPPVHSPSEPHSLRNGVILAPLDGGYAAWSFLIAAAMVEAIVWSIPFSFGIFLTAYLQEPMLASQPHASTLLPLIGTLSSGIIYCSGALIYPYMTYYPKHRRPLMWLGTLLCWISLFGASYVRKVHQLVILQGALYAIGGALIYPPCISFMSEWFVRRRGFANGVLFAGTAAGGLVLPFILPPLLSAYGPFSTLRILSIAILLLLLLCLFFIKPRLPENRVRGPARRAEASFVWLRSWSWWILVVANTLQGFAFFVPMLWVPTFASALQLNTSTSSLALALLNGSSALGPLVVGALSDHFTPWPIAFITAALSSVCTVVFWGAIGNVVGLMLFGATYGLVAGGWSTLWSTFVRRISKEDPSLSLSLYGFLMLARGLGNVLCTPISTTLANISSTISVAESGRSGFSIEGGRFEKLIVYIGVCYASVAVAALIGWGHEKITTRVH